MATVRSFPEGSADDPVRVDSKHYKVEFENDRVRVVRISYAPGERSVMHSHPESVAVFLTDAKTKFLPGRADRGHQHQSRVGDAHGRIHAFAGEHQQEGFRGNPSGTERLVSGICVDLKRAGQSMPALIVCCPFRDADSERKRCGGGTRGVAWRNPARQRRLHPDMLVDAKAHQTPMFRKVEFFHVRGLIMN